jgi:hypothetical protein
METMAGVKRLLAALGTVVLVSCVSHPVVPGPIGPPPDGTAPATDTTDGGITGPEQGDGANGAATEFVVTEEVYQRTFEEIEAVIVDLNAIIRAGDFASWERRLTAAYRERASSREYLDEVSQSPLLKQSGAKLATLEDYFRKVVVPSRSSVKLDQLAFVDATHVKAITVIQGEAYILYWLVRENGMWNIGIW